MRVLHAWCAARARLCARVLGYSGIGVLAA